MVYIFDTSSFKVLGNYFPKSFPTVWQKIDLLVSKGNLKSVREVLKEVEYGNNKQIFLPPTAQETLFIAIWYLSCDASRVRITGILANSL